MYTEEQISIAINNIIKLNNAPIVRFFDGYIIMAQSESDYITKKNKIIRGDRYGFYTIEHALKLKIKNE